MSQNTKANILDIYELTPMQQGMLFHTLYTQGSDAYVEQFSYNLTGELDVELFQKAWQEIVNRHNVLRTSFQWRGVSKPVQLVNKSVILPWETIDWSGVPQAEKDEKLKKFIVDDRRKAFSMEQAPLMRCTLIKLSENTYQLIWSFHHILMDGWSYPILQKEVFTIYEALKEGKQINLPRPAPYKQYVQWLNQQDRIAAEKYWRKELQDFNSPTPMIVDNSVKSDVLEDIDDIEIKLSEELTKNLQSFAKQNQLTLNTIVQGVWAIILSTYRGEQDVLFGGVVSGRTPSITGIENMVGLFINTLPVRVKVDFNSELIPWLRTLQKNYIDRDQYSYSSLVDMQEWSGIPRGTQLFENIVVFENYPLDKTQENGAAGIKINDLRAIERTNFPLMVLIAPGESLTIHIAYEILKFHKSTIDQILSNFKTLLQEFVENPSRKLSEIPILSNEDRNRILVEWNKTKKNFPADKCVHHLFEEEAEKNPNAIAVEFENSRLTYKELNEKANQVANYLLKNGLKPDSMVGIFIERSLEMVIGLLGILKAGGAYVSLDSTYPAERIRFMIEDTDISILLTKKSLLDKLPATKAKTVLLDSDADKIFKENKNYPDTNVNSSNLAYVIFTSGSTGKPKGVLMMHKALTNLLNWQVNGQEFSRGLRTLQFTTLSFDVAFQEIFSTWYSGGTLVLITEAVRQDLSSVLKALKEKKIERLFLAFIALQQLAELFYTSKDKTLYLKEVITAGEQLQSTPAIINLFKCLRDFRFSNHYGPSESHVVTSHTLSKNPDQWVKLPPIGKPIYNTQIYILDSSLNPVPVGVTGELYIGGTALVRGYHNRPELTSEKFIDNPFNTNLSEKLYKTGDLARYLRDGTIEYLGRSDNQIKLRGFRIELGEIESVLGEYPDVKNAVVVAKEFGQGDKKLIAYIVPNSTRAPQTSDLKKYLKLKLPEYMIPSDFLILNNLPLTPTGKINHRALPEPEFLRIDKDNEYEQPKDTLELQLVNIWEKVLSVKPIGIKDNFFELGGHSLLALRVFGYIEKLTGKKLALSVLFDSPTIEQLANIIRDDGWSPPWKSLVAVKPGGSKLPFYCVPPAAGTALHFQALVKYLPEDQPFYVLESIGLNGKDVPHTKLEEMAAYYVKEIQTLQPEGPYLLGGRCFGGRVVFEMAQQFVKQGQKVALLAIFDTWPPFIAPPPNYVPPERNLKHFFARSFHHLKTGQLRKVVYNYSSNNFRKYNWRIRNKLEYILSGKKKKLFKQIMAIHFKAQDRYIAKKYAGKITLIECATFRQEYRKGWKNLAEGGFEYYVVPHTNHKTIVKDPKLKEFAEKLNFVLQKTHDEIDSIHKTNERILSGSIPGKLESTFV